MMRGGLEIDLERRTRNLYMGLKRYLNLRNNAVSHLL
jgi:hypothetical protein